MNDFLNSLVERSLSPTASVRPQLFSIFETPQTNGGAFFHGREGAELPSTGHDRKELRDRHSPLHQQTTPPAPSTHLNVVASKFSSSSGERPGSPGVQARIPRSADLRGNEESVVQSTLRSAAGNGTTQEKPRLPDKQIQGPADANKPVPVRSTNDDPHESRSKIIEIVGAGGDSRRELIEVREVHTVLRPARPRKPIALPLQPKNSSGTTSINVTIGRVEVRAVPPPTQRHDKPKTVAAGLTLEDYLRRRSKKGSR
jgi:hypothetical protein